jgi:hypothetical protein
MEKTFQYHQQIFAGLELEIYNDLLKKDKIFLQCIGVCLLHFPTKIPLQSPFTLQVGIDLYRVIDS